LKRRRRLYFSIACLIFLTAFAVLFLTLLRYDFFAVNRIEIIGAKRVSQREIQKRSGLIAGKSMILFFEDKVKREILKNQWITSVSIEKEFPKKVIIRVKEAEPFCVVLRESGDSYYMSENGEELGRANFNEGLDFPVLIGEGIEKSELVGEALDILKFSLKSNALNWKDISEINLDSIYGITVFTTDGRRIDFGQHNIEKKWYKVEKIIANTRRINLTERYINISSEKTGIVNFEL